MAIALNLLAVLYTHKWATVGARPGGGGARLGMRFWSVSLGVCGILAALGVASLAQAQYPVQAVRGSHFLVRPANLAYLVQRADVIVEGRVVQVRYEGHPEYRHVPTVRVTLEVERMLRGSHSRRFAFREWMPSPSFFGGKRGYVVGQRLLLFLPSPSVYGLTSPIGYE